MTVHLALPNGLARDLFSLLETLSEQIRSMPDPPDEARQELTTCLAVLALLSAAGFAGDQP